MIMSVFLLELEEESIEGGIILLKETILGVARKFLFTYLKGKELGYREIHSWRNNWKFIVLHSFRVESYVRKILEREEHLLSDDEVTLTCLAAILHDIGRIHKLTGHASLGKKIISDWLKSEPMLCRSIVDSDRLLAMIERHTSKDEVDSDYCSRVLKDADVLDEIGVMSIFMASNWIDREDPYFFHLLLERVGGFEISFCDKGFELLNTHGAKEILLEKREFINLFVSQLNDELDGTEMFLENAVEF